MKKEILWIILLVIAFITLIIYGSYRTEKINNGEMTLVNQNQMDR